MSDNMIIPGAYGIDQDFSAISVSSSGNVVGCVGVFRKGKVGEPIYVASDTIEKMLGTPVTRIAESKYDYSGLGLRAALKTVDGAWVMRVTDGNEKQAVAGKSSTDKFVFKTKTPTKELDGYRIKVVDKSYGTDERYKISLLDTNGNVVPGEEFDVVTTEGSDEFVESVIAANSTELEVVYTRANSRGLAEFGLTTKNRVTLGSEGESNFIKLSPADKYQDNLSVVFVKDANAISVSEADNVLTIQYKAGTSTAADLVAALQEIDKVTIETGASITGMMSETTSGDVISNVFEDTLKGGDSGYSSEISTSKYISALAKFEDRNAININLFMAPGITDLAFHKEVISMIASVS